MLETYTSTYVKPSSSFNLRHSIRNPPTANYDRVVNSGVTFKIVIDVVANDTDPNGDLDPISTVICSQAGSGGAIVRSDGQVVYESNLGWHGTDTLTYTVSDLAECLQYRYFLNNDL